MQPNMLSGMWVYGYLMEDNLYIAPVILGTDDKPIGFAVYNSQDSVDRRLKQETVISSVLKLPDGIEKVSLFILGKTMTIDVFLCAGIHMYRQCYGTNDDTDSKFRDAIMFINPPSMKLDETMVNAMVSDGRAFRLSSCVDVSIPAIIAWRS